MLFEPYLHNPEHMHTTNFKYAKLFTCMFENVYKYWDMVPSISGHLGLPQEQRSCLTKCTIFLVIGHQSGVMRSFTVAKEWQTSWLGGRYLRNGKFILHTEEFKGWLTLLSKTRKLHCSLLLLFVFIVVCCRRHCLSASFVIVCPCCSLSFLFVVVIVCRFCHLLLLSWLLHLFLYVLLSLFGVVVVCHCCWSLSLLLVVVCCHGFLSLFIVVERHICYCEMPLLFVVVKLIVALFVVCFIFIDCRCCCLLSLLVFVVVVGCCITASASRCCVPWQCEIGQLPNRIDGIMVNYHT